MGIAYPYIMGDFSQRHNLTVIFKDNPDSDDDFGGTHAIQYGNSTHKFTSDHMIILNHSTNGGVESVEGHVFPLKSVKSFKWQ